VCDVASIRTRRFILSNGETIVRDRCDRAWPLFAWDAPEAPPARASNERRRAEGRREIGDVVRVRSTAEFVRLLSG
jgi:hypothetical protein